MEWEDLIHSHYINDWSVIMLTCAEMWEHKWLYVEGLVNTLPPSDAVLWWWFNCTGMA